jgi:hypothetical protein
VLFAGVVVNFLNIDRDFQTTPLKPCIVTVAVGAMRGRIIEVNTWQKPSQSEAKSCVAVPSQIIDFSTSSAVQSINKEGIPLGETKPHAGRRTTTTFQVLHHAQ